MLLNSSTINGVMLHGASLKYPINYDITMELVSSGVIDLAVIRVRPTYSPSTLLSTGEVSLTDLYRVRGLHTNLEGKALLKVELSKSNPDRLFLEVSGLADVVLDKATLLNGSVIGRFNSPVLPLIRDRAISSQIALQSDISIVLDKYTSFKEIFLESSYKASTSIYKNTLFKPVLITGEGITSKTETTRIRYLEVAPIALGEIKKVTTFINADGLNRDQFIHKMFRDLPPEFMLREDAPIFMYREMPPEFMYKEVESDVMFNEPM